MRASGEAGIRTVAALKDALAARPSFPELFTWFYAKENDELREQKQHRDSDYQRRDLSAVRGAIASMLDGVTDPRVEMDPLRFSVSVGSEEGSSTTLELDQLSGGQRAVLALAADLAWRMAQGNPHLDEPLRSEAIVLIDEVELHLHPSWQQRILNDLRRTFPNAQFIVSTHSPQVLTTVEPRAHRRTRSRGGPHRCRIRGRVDVRRGGRRRTFGRDEGERAASERVHPEAWPLQAADLRREGRIPTGLGAQAGARRSISR